MDASPLLARLVAALNSPKLEAVLIGNAAAAIRRVAMPIEQRMNFLRKRLPGGGSCL